MMKMLINPFRYIAGGKSLVLGIVVLLLTAIIGYYSHTHFPDVLSLKLIGNPPLVYLILQVLMNWFVLSFFLYIIALVVSSSAVRAIDIFGTQALARFPFLIGSFIGFSEAFTNFGDYAMDLALGKESPIEMTGSDIAISIFIILLSLLLLVWIITLMYNAFKISANLKGGKAIGFFILGLVLSIAGTMAINGLLLNVYFSNLK